mmetsp:Transcript_36494/g.40302  ORF Transcript_36494/g.40302 Transcript_36494/m.40302 type:complete len:114 (+) Transcript_36494:29-370(+)
MKFDQIASFAAIAGLGLTGSSYAFQPLSLSERNVAVVNNNIFSDSCRPAALTATATDEEEAAPCDTPDGVIPEFVTAQALRSASLTNADGEIVTLGEKMGKGTSIVIFLRHLG